MVGTATIPGGVTGTASLSPAERQAAQNALTKLQSRAGSLGSGLDSGMRSATVYSGSTQSQGTRLSNMGKSTLMAGQGNDTFLGGARGASSNAVTHIGNDTVVSGSATLGGPASLQQMLAGPSGQHFSLSSDTINVAGATAAHVQAVHPQDTTGTHTITLADKTTITIAGLSPHDISKLPH